MEGKFQARLILEIIGRPAQNIIDALNGLADRMAKEKGVKLLERVVHPAVEVKDAKDLYTTFAEIMLECDSLSTFFGIVFAYMPANIEILSPEYITLKNADLTGMANRIMQRLHNYDAVARRMIVDNERLKKQLAAAGIDPAAAKQPAETQAQAQAQPQQPQPAAEKKEQPQKKPKSKPKSKAKKGKKR